MELQEHEAVHELNITELRKQRRPLWMSDLGIDDYSDIVGGGGDIYCDRLPPAWPRHKGEELTEEEERDLGAINVEEYESHFTGEQTLAGASEIFKDSVEKFQRAHNAEVEHIET